MVVAVASFASWLEYLDAQSRDPSSDLSKWESKHPDTIHGCCTMAAADLKLLLSVSGEGALLLYPTDGIGSIRVLHHFFVMPTEEPDGSQKLHLLAVNGLRAIAEFASVPDESIRGKVAKKIRPMKVPSIAHFLGCDSAESFGDLRGGDSDPEASAFLKGWHNAYILPAEFLQHGGQMSFSTSDFAMKVIIELSNKAQDISERDVEEVALVAKEHHKLLVWLWAVELGLFTHQALNEVPSNDDIEARCREIRAHLDQDIPNIQVIPGLRARLPPPPDNIGRSPPLGPPPIFGADDALMRDVLHSLAKVQEQNTRRDTKEQNSKMMTHRLTKEDADLYRYLSAQDFDDKHPTINRFTEGFLSDKDPTKALNLFRGVINRENWDCVPSKNCLIQFFAQGFIGHDFDSMPSGLTLFMFWPAGKLHARSKEETKMGIRHLFGSDPIDEDTVKMFAQSDLYLPTSLDELVRQIESMIRFLDLITGDHSVATGGYREALYQLRIYGKKLVALSKRSSLWVRIGFFIDQVFQSFATELANIIRENDGSKQVMRAAREVLDGSMERDIRNLLESCRFGVVPNLVLPITWERTEDEPEENPHAYQRAKADDNSSFQVNMNLPRKLAVEKANHQRNVDPTWWSKNPEPVSHWRLPHGKKLSDVFDLQDPNRQAWTKGWPQVPHHLSGKQAFVCQRYQTLAQCRKKCRGAHIIPSQLTKEDFEAIDDKVKMGYQAL